MLVCYLTGMFMGVYIVWYEDLNRKRHSSFFPPFYMYLHIWTYITYIYIYMQVFAISIMWQYYLYMSFDSSNFWMVFLRPGVQCGMNIAPLKLLLHGLYAGLGCAGGKWRPGMLASCSWSVHALHSLCTPERYFAGALNRSVISKCEFCCPIDIERRLEF